MFTLEILPLNAFSEDFFKTYTVHHDGDSGIDIPYPETQMVGGWGVLTNLGIKAAMKNGMGQYVSYWLAPRSSIYKTPIRMCNSEGIIDAGYRGELKAPIDVLGSTEELARYYKIEQGTKLFQIAAPTLGQIRIKLVDSLDSTTRGSGGFGSTNK